MKKDQLLRLLKKQILTLAGYKNIKDFYMQEGKYIGAHSGRNKFGSRKHLAKIAAYNLK